LKHSVEQFLQYKYLSSWITEDGKCESDVKARISMAKDAFWKQKELLQGKINLRVKKRILRCYIFPVMKYGCERGTLKERVKETACNGKKRTGNGV